MEGMEEVEYVGSPNNEASVTQIVKGKRTKRQRPFSPCAVVAGMTSSSSSASADHEHVSGAADYGSISSTTTTHNNYDISTDLEEEDMANCLILLAQGQHANAFPHQNQNQSHGSSGGGVIKAPERGATRRSPEMATATAAKIGFYLYECKTCNRAFPSFQALGGHRASHKRPKLAVEEKKPSRPPPPSSSPQPPRPPPISSQLINNYEFEEGQLKISSQISVQLGNNNGVLQQSNKAKVHECSICGSEFTSGQALGGHMRRHRASTTAGCNAAGTAAEVVVKPRNILALDLNLPAPEEDLRESKYHQFTPKQKPNLVLAAPSLVDCHY